MIVRVVHGEFESRAMKTENPERELSSGGSSESEGLEKRRVLLRHDPRNQPARYVMIT
jgi:hypothetical protein